MSDKATYICHYLEIESVLVVSDGSLDSIRKICRKSCSKSLLLRHVLCTATSVNNF